MLHLSVFCLLITTPFVLIAQQVIPFCSYCECSFESSSNAVDLDCTNTDMKGILLDSYFWYDDYNASYRVATLRARNSNLEVIDREFPSSTLRLLDLSGSGITRIIDGAFSNLQNLEELDLSNNSLEYIKPDIFKGMYFVGEYYPLKKLKILKLNSNNLKVLHQNSFNHIKNIEELHLASNQLEEVGSSTQIALKALHHLRILNLSCTKLEDLPDDLFSGHFKKLEILDLSENFFLTIPRTIQDLSSLETLYFSSNPILELDGKSGFVGRYVNLKTLHLTYMPNLEAIHAHSLSGLKFLDELHLHHNVFLSYINGRAFYSTDEVESELPQLRFLDIHDCNLTRMSSTFLPYWKTLDYLNISGNPWICDCYNQEFIETVALANAEEARNVLCTKSNKSFYQVREEGVVLPCPNINRSFNNFLFLLVLTVFVNVLAFLACCLCRKRFKRAGIYVTVKHV